MADWRSFKFTCEETDGWLGVKDAWADGSSWLYQVGDSVGVLIESALLGEEGVLWYGAEKIMVPKALDTLDVFGVGDIVYWDPATRLVTAVPDSGMLRIGICTEPAIFTDALVEIDLMGAGVAAEPEL
jgi:predicted RecA/RadA family phage recombinase